MAPYRPGCRGRVDEALRLYRNRQVHKLFVSGGIGKTRYPEGDGMRNYLVAKGVPTEDIIVDNEGDNSYLTARNFQNLNKQGNFKQPS